MPKKPPLTGECFVIDRSTGITKNVKDIPPDELEVIKHKILKNISAQMSDYYAQHPELLR